MVSVYNTTSFQSLDYIALSGLGARIYGLSAISIDNRDYLFIADYVNTCVHAVNLSATSNVSKVTWNVPNQPSGISVTSKGVVYVEIGSIMIEAYTSSGQHIRSIGQIGGSNLVQAVETRDGVH